MVIEERRFLELAVHVKLASEAVLAAAQSLEGLRPTHGDGQDESWRRMMDELLTLNIEIGFMERILRTAARRASAPTAAVTRRSFNT